MPSPTPHLRVAITGASGFLGSAAVHILRGAGHDVIVLKRNATSSPDCAAWDPATGALDTAALGAIDAVLHLAGENLVGRWTKGKQRAIRDSRIGATERLSRAFAQMSPRPRAFVVASGTGYHGDSGDTVIDETSPAGTGFVAELARDWEAATSPARDAGMRTVQLRLGMVLDPSGAALKKMLPAFRFGLGGRLGTGRQWISWITRRDAVRVMQFAIEHEPLAGPVLAVTPNPVTNAEFTRALGKALRRPTLFPVPAFVLRLVFGEMASMLLTGQRCAPRRLVDAGFRFADPDLGPALALLLHSRDHTTTTTPGT